MPGLINYPTSGFEQGYKTSTAGVTGFRTALQEGKAERKSEAVESRANEELELRKKTQQQRSDLDNFNKVLSVGKSMPQSKRGSYYSQMAESATNESNKTNLTYLSTVSDSVHKDLTTSYAQMGKYLDQQDYQSAKEVHIRMKTLYPDSPIVKQHEEILQEQTKRTTQSTLATLYEYEEYDMNEELIPGEGIRVKDKVVKAMAMLEKTDPEEHANYVKRLQDKKDKASTGTAQDIATWITPGGKTINLRKGEMPPQGSTKAPTVSVRKSTGDAIDDAMPDELLAFEEEYGRKPTATERRDIRQKVADNIKREGISQTGGKASARATVNALPKLRENAHKAVQSKKRMSKMLDMLPSGVTGKPGQLKKALAGWLEFFPEFADEKIQNYSDAQLFALLGRLMTGPMRLDIVGPGPVSEAEQKLWDTMSAGGGAAEPAARSLIEMYIDIADESVDFYNESRDAASKGNPTVSLQFQRIGKKKKSTESKQDKLRDKYDY